MFDERCLRGQIFAPAISAFTTSLWLSCALGHDYMDIGGRAMPGAIAEDARKYDHKEVGGRVAPGAATENNAGRCSRMNKCLKRAWIARRDSVVEQGHLSCSDEGILHGFYEGLVSWGVFLSTRKGKIAWSNF